MKNKNLTIQEAIKSGLPFKREKWAMYRTKLDLGYECLLNDLDILAEDYELEVPEIKITREKLEEAVNKCFYYYANPKGLEEHKLFIAKLAKELGL